MWRSALRISNSHPGQQAPPTEPIFFLHFFPTLRPPCTRGNPTPARAQNRCVGDLCPLLTKNKPSLQPLLLPRVALQQPTTSLQPTLIQWRAARRRNRNSNRIKVGRIRSNTMTFATDDVANWRCCFVFSRLPVGWSFRAAPLRPPLRPHRLLAAPFQAESRRLAESS